MKAFKVWILVLFVFSSTACSKNPPEGPDKGNEKTDIEIIQDAAWESKSVSEGVTWKYFHFDDLFKSKQSVTLFEIDLKKAVEIDIPYVNSGFLKTSDGSINTRALVGFNGGFFNTSTGGSTVFFKKDGEIIKHTRDGFTPYRENGAMIIEGNSNIRIVDKPEGGWESLTAPTALASGPLLIIDGDALNQKDKPFNSNRHPRTAIGVTDDDRLLVFVVDGRSSQAHGMSIKELTTLFEAFDCNSALNLDGGGSSTAWVKNRGVVNYPSDNKEFDHQGERGVATVIVVK